MVAAYAACVRESRRAERPSLLSLPKFAPSEQHDDAPAQQVAIAADRTS